MLLLQEEKKNADNKSRLGRHSQTSPTQRCPPAKPDHKIINVLTDKLGKRCVTRKRSQRCIHIDSLTEVDVGWRTAADIADS